MSIDNFYKDKKVLVAGASGLTGRNLYERMVSAGADVIGTCFNNQEYISLPMSGITDPVEVFYKIDFTNENETMDFFQNRYFDYVFICCAKTYNAQTCKDDPQSMIMPNINMAGNILENSLKTGVKKVVYISSATVYQPTKIDVPLSESDMDWNVNPHSIYMGVGWAKRYIEKLCEFYSTIGLNTAVVRPTNIYGRYDKHDSKYCHVIPALILRGIRKDNPFIINSLGDGVKNFVYVDDFVRDLMKVGAFYDCPEPVNITSDEYFSIREVVQLLFDVLNESDPDYRPDIRFKDIPDEVSYIGLKRDRLDSILGKESYKSFKEGLRETVEWYSSLLQTQKV